MFFLSHYLPVTTVEVEHSKLAVDLDSGFYRKIEITLQTST